MAIKETIAFVGEVTDNQIDLVFACAAKRYPILLVMDDQDYSEEILNQVLSKYPNADIEIITAAKDGCWEADVIILLQAACLQEDFLVKIKEVATQKLVVFIENQNILHDISEIGKFEKILPHSIVIKLSWNVPFNKFSISGSDQKALNFITMLFDEK